MEVMCKAKFIRIAPRKTRLLAGLVRGLTVEEARKQLMFSQKEAAEPMLKAINSAVANAVHNHRMTGEGLVVSRVIVDEGPKIKRVTPRAQGRATPIRLRMSHITVWVSPAGEVVAKKPVARRTTKAERKLAKTASVESTTK
ncbi:MAG: 50S ribosomal protein L22 [Patescibacteria group bacterium]